MDLRRRHPAVLALGLTRLALILAVRGRASTLTVLLEIGERAARENHDVILEIARDADRGRFAVRELLADGHASSADQLQLDGIFSEIATQATEGRILS